MLSRIFRNGNSLAVRIPKELAFNDEVQEVEIVRKGNGLWIQPVQAPSLAGLGDIFAMFSPDFMAAGREFHEQTERDWGGTSAKDGA